MTVRAPWTSEQVARIVRWQETPWVHQLTCETSGHGALTVFPAGGLVCLRCGYRQTWVPDVVANHEPPPDPREQLGVAGFKP